MDRVTPEVRSRMMSSIRGRDTKPELVMRRGLHGLGFRFRLHDPRFPGRPDLVLPKWNAVLFVHGCFWHRHPGCRFAASPKTRTEFWEAKFEANRRRDERDQTKLRLGKIRIGVIWECSLRTDGLTSETLGTVSDWIVGPHESFETGLVFPAVDLTTT